MLFGDMWDDKTFDASLPQARNSVLYTAILFCA